MSILFTANEMLALNKFLQMETNSLVIAKARIKALQQFIAENNIVTAANMNMNTNTAASIQAETDQNLPKGVM